MTHRSRCAAPVARLLLRARSSENGTPLSSRGSGGRPSTRSPTMLRRISSVPPADFRPGRSDTSLPQSRRPRSAVGAERVGEQLAGRDRRPDRRHLRQPALRARDAAALQRREHPVAGEAQREELGARSRRSGGGPRGSRAAGSSASSASAKRSARQPKPSPPRPIVTRSNISVVMRDAPAAVDRPDRRVRRRARRRRRRPR